MIEYGPALIEHALLRFGFTNASKVGKTFIITNDLPKLMEAIQEADSILESAKNQPFKVIYFIFRYSILYILLFRDT